MSRWDSCSEGRSVRSAWRALAPGALLCALWGTPALPVVIQSQEDALAEAFPGAEVERRTLFLEPEQVERIQERAGSAPSSRVVTYYVGRRDGAVLGTAYFDTHRVRTLPEVLLVVVDPGGRVRRVAVLSFQEPGEYLPRERWFDQFHGRVLDEELSLKRGIRGITGATLSGRAATAAVRRVLAVHAIVMDAAAAAPEEEEP